MEKSIEQESQEKADAKEEINVATIRNDGIKYKSESSTIELATYHPYSETLLVDFKSGSSYAYYNVPWSTWENFLEAESVGRFIAREIKNSFKWKKIIKDEDGTDGKEYREER